MVEVMKRYVRSSNAICFQFRVGQAAELTSGELVANPLAEPEFSGAQIDAGDAPRPGAAAERRRILRNLRALLKETASL